MNRFTLAILLMLLITPMMFGQSSTTPTQETPTLIPPPHLQRMEILPSGERVLVFSNDGWKEISKIVWTDRVRVAEKAVREAIVPLIIENQDLTGRVKGWRTGTIVSVLAAVAAIAIAIFK